MTAYDEIIEANADDECRAWIRRLIDARDEVVAFVDARLDGKGTGECIGFLKGSDYRRSLSNHFVSCI